MLCKFATCRLAILCHYCNKSHGAEGLAPMVFIVQAAITIMESEIANRDNFSKQMYIQYYYYITYSNDDCCYDSSNYIKDLDLERERESVYVVLKHEY